MPDPASDIPDYAPKTLRYRLWLWWVCGFGWCRFLGHRYDVSAGECLRCGGIPDEVWEADRG